MEKKSHLEALAPAFSRKNVPIVLCCSEYYSLYCAAYLQSLTCYISADCGYDIIIFTKDISEDSQQELCDIGRPYPNLSIRFVDINPYIARYVFQAHSHFGIESYFRLLIPYILTNYDKAYYFDCDMVLRQDVAELRRVPLGNAYLAGCLDTVIIGAINDPADQSFGPGRSWMMYCLETLNMKNPYTYLNSGVLIFNLRRFRQDFTVDQILDFAQKKQFYLLDQDALNALCSTDVVILEHAWNMTNNNGNGKISYILKSPVEIAQTYFDARKRPNTVHYADRFKPWKNPNEDLGYEFWHDARNIPHYHRILGRMSQELYKQLVGQTSTNHGEQILYLPMGVLKEWKMKLKQWSSIFLPYDSIQRKTLKKWYFKMRGWPCSEG